MRLWDLSAIGDKQALISFSCSLVLHNLNCFLGVVIYYWLFFCAELSSEFLGEEFESSLWEASLVTWAFFLCRSLIYLADCCRLETTLSLMFELHTFLMIESISIESFLGVETISSSNSGVAVFKLLATHYLEANFDLCLQHFWEFSFESSSNFETTTSSAALSAALRVSQSQQAKNISWVLSFGELATDCSWTLSA